MKCGALHVIIRNQSVPVEYSVHSDPDVTRAERERRIIEDLIARDARFKDHSREMASLVLDAKRLALSDESPEKIVTLIEQQLIRNSEVSKDAVVANAASALARNAAAVASGDN